MSQLVFALRDAPAERLDLSSLTPAGLAALDIAAIQRLPIGTSAHNVMLGDVFKVSGHPGATIVIEGGAQTFDCVGAGLAAGSIVVDGDVGAFAASAMTGGRLEVRGNAGSGLAAGMTGGHVSVLGNAGDGVGAPRSGERFGMAGGIVAIEGDIGQRAGDRMRRGTIVVKGRCGGSAGFRMMGGTIWTDTALGPAPGTLMRRGTLIAPALDPVPATFADCGGHDLVALRLLNRYAASQLGSAAPRPLPHMVRRLMGDLATIGKGEILLTA